MERVDHVDVVQIHGCRFIRHIDRVLEREVPYREGFKLGVARLDATLLIVVELRQAGCHFSASGTGSGDDHKRFCGFDVIVFAVTVVADNLLYIGGVSLNGIVAVDLDAEVLQPLDKGIRRRLFGVMGDDDAADVNADRSKGVDQAEGIHVVGDAEVAPDLVLFNGDCRHHHNDLGIFLHAEKHFDFGVRAESGQYPGGVVIVKELSSELQIKLAAKAGNALLNLLGLQSDILIVIKADGVHKNPRNSSLVYLSILIHFSIFFKTLLKIC